MTNGLLLRADIHALFDLGKIAVFEGDYTLRLHQTIRKGSYTSLHGMSLSLPSNPQLHPNKESLRSHRLRYGISDRL